VQIGYRLHRKLLLDAIASLKEQQPDGTAEPGNLWEYIHDDPTTAALYVSGVLCTPRLTMLWLHTFEYNATLGPLLADEDEASDTVAYHAPSSIQEFLVLFPVRANKILFWLGWLCCPALMVSFAQLWGPCCPSTVTHTGFLFLLFRYTHISAYLSRRS
jgi:hypothetical protein